MRPGWAPAPALRSLRAEKHQGVRLTPRLQTVLELLGEHGVMADVGCDHGRLGAALLQRGRAQKVICTDIGELPLEKARALAKRCGLSARMEFRLGDGLSVLAPGEAQAFAVCGMGGELIARMLSHCSLPLCGADISVLQPMRGVEALRKFLYETGLRVLQDRIVQEGRRFYQVLLAAPGTPVAPPPGWPEGCFAMGPGALGDPLFSALARQLLAQHEKRLLTARGTGGEALLVRQAEDMLRLLELERGYS